MRNTNPFVHEFYVDLKNGTTQYREKKPLAQGDAYADKIIVHVQEGGHDVPLDGVGVSAKVIRYDGQTVTLVGSVEDGAACVVLDPACYTVPGDVKVSVALSAGDMVQTVLALLMNVENSETGIVVDNGVIGDLTSILTAIAEMRTATDAANNAAAEAMETTAAVIEDAQAAVDEINRESDAAKEALATEVRTAIAEMSAAVSVAAPSIMEDSAASIVTVDDAASRPAVQLVSTIKPAQPGTGDPSPDNVRPISGWDTANLTRTGRNLVSHLDYIKTNGHTATTLSESYIDVTNPTQYDYGNIPVQLKAGVTYTLVIDWEVYGRDDASTGNTSASYYIGKAGTTSAYIRTRTNGVNRVVKQYTFEEDMKGRISWCPNSDSSLPACSRSRIMLLEGEYTADTAPAFEPCDKQSLTADLPETVYGGTLDWTTGLLTVTHEAISYDGTEEWTFAPTNHVCSLNGMPSRLLIGNQEVYHICSHYRPRKYATGASQTDKSCYTLNTTTLMVKDTSLTSLEDWTAYLASQAAAGTPMTIVWQLKPARYVTHQLTPQQLDMLKGCNAVWSDAGETSVVYIADTKLYIDNAVAAIAAAIINN